MNKFVTLAAGATLFFSACYSVMPTLESVSLQPGLVMPPHDCPIETFYLRESLAGKSFTEMALIQVNYPGYASDAYLLPQAQAKARELGADGIFILDRKEDLSYLKGDLYDHASVDRSALRAIAFVYNEHLRDSIRVASVKETKRTFFVKITGSPEINLYRTPDANPDNVAQRVTDFEPMEMLERTEVVLYNEKRTLKSYFFKVRYRAEEAYVSGFDVRKL